jgi:hypothetical protein
MSKERATIVIYALLIGVYFFIGALHLAGCGGKSSSQDTITISCSQTITIEMPEARAQELALEAAETGEPFDVLGADDWGNGDVTVTATMCTDFWSEHETSQDTTTTAVTTTGTVSLGGAQ